MVESIYNRQPVKVLGTLFTFDGVFYTSEKDEKILPETLLSLVSYLPEA